MIHLQLITFSLVEVARSFYIKSPIYGGGENKIHTKIRRFVASKLIEFQRYSLSSVSLWGLHLIDLIDSSCDTEI